MSFVIEDNVEMIESLAFSLNNHYLLTERYRLLANSLGIEVNFIGDIEKIQNEIQKRESAAKIESIIVIITFFVSIMLYFGKL